MSDIFFSVIFYNGFVAEGCISSEVGRQGVPKMGCRDAKGGLENLSLDVRGGSERQRYSDERILPDGLTFISLRKYCVSEE